jgi:hypothetical protein
MGLYQDLMKADDEARALAMRVDIDKLMSREFAGHPINREFERLDQLAWSWLRGRIDELEEGSIMAADFLRLVVRLAQ